MVNMFSLNSENVMLPLLCYLIRSYFDGNYYKTTLLCLIFSVLFTIVVREARGPFNDPQHPYLYEEEDVWMAPGFINQFYEVMKVHMLGLPLRLSLLRCNHTGAFSGSRLLETVC